jgi:tetratricopeptide (TPR) repeat protein
MYLILILILMGMGHIGQAVNSSDMGSKYDEAYRRSGLTAFLQWDYPQAEKDLKSALAEARSFGSFDRRLATASNDLGQVCARTGRLDAAKKLLQQSVAILRTKDPGHDLCVVLNNLGQLYLAKDMQKDVQHTFAVALALARKSRGPMDGVISDILSNVGLLQEKQKKYGRAKASFQRSLELRQTTFGPDSLKLAETLNDLGTLYLLRSDYSKGKEMLEQSLRISEKLLPPDHPDLAVVLENLGVVENKLHQFEASEAFFRRSVAIQTKERTIARPELLAVYADTLRNLNKQNEAAVLLSQMKRLLEQQRFIVKANPS